MNRSLGCGLGFISEESVLRKSLYMYDKKEKIVIEQPFVEFVEQSDVWNGRSATNQTSPIWGNAYKLAASSVVISMLLIGSPSFDIKNNSLTGYDFVLLVFYKTTKFTKNNNFLNHYLCWKRILIVFYFSSE